MAATITGDHQNRVTDYTNIAVKENDSPKLFAMQAFGHYEDAGVASAQLSRQYKDATDIVVERKPRRYIVRRLTPTECARLQGFPDWWTDGVAGSDSNKYKMWGNGMALPCMLAVASAIQSIETEAGNT